MNIDPFGNVTDIDTPLNIIPEKITVTKLVYDDDKDEPEDLVKATRSKTKKTR